MWGRGIVFFIVGNGLWGALVDNVSIVYLWQRNVKNTSVIIGKREKYLYVCEDGAEAFGERFDLNKQRNKPVDESVRLSGFVLTESDFSLHK